ncbi:hypothetical protein EJ04DRAFT_544921 [Polyplosphaeria fusca]|uniref:AA9 family lytic polysaccharide monooxygenase n=1 Tax=Polyplosphaeria fusca TaxID=682080 RepID=A0A9P4QVA5_9PLEO|nr:hypothetical protein EJ04DRAFT_544921 [Polyplosphaeria fusca]
MHFTTSTLLPLLAVPLASAHYTFSGLMHDGKMVGRDWEYIREHKRGYMPTKFDEILADDFRCNQGASSGASTSVYSVKPGDKIGFKQAFGATAIEHPGPVQVYMSKAPGDVKSYDGSGDWVKVFEGLLCKDQGAEGLKTNSWCSWGDNTIDFVVPSTLPSGEYLVRVEHIAIHGAHDKQAEFYYSCAQVSLEGSSATSIPGEKVKIPGVYAVDDAPINFSVWGQSTTYPEIPGPEVIPGGQFRGSVDGKSAQTVTVQGGSEQNEKEPVQTPAATSSAAAAQTSCPHIGSPAAEPFNQKHDQSDMQ